MYIKQVIIQGFKSYKDETLVEPFSPKHNVIVGRNGSGKSNFFAAIRFVLSDAYTHMGREERQALLHEGTGSAVMSAYVEIIFDNSDYRFPTGRDVTVIRRTIGLKKDEYSLDHRSATKNDIVNLFESGGFSRSNPYYIVPQGRVTALITAKDAERLQLLKEIAGTKVYEQRREESERIMAQTLSKKEKIDELMSSINVRIRELEDEKQELSQYQDADKDRRCLEYALYSRELDEITNVLSELDSTHDSATLASDELKSEFLARETQIDEANERLDDLRRDRQVCLVEMEQIQSDMRSQIKTKAALELSAVDNIEQDASGVQKKEELQSRLQEVEETIAARQKELDEVESSHAALFHAYQNAKQALAQAEVRYRAHRDKLSRTSIFSTKAERDVWLNSEIEQVSSVIAQKQDLLNEMASESEVLAEKVMENESKVEDLRARVELRESEVKVFLADADKAKEELDRLNDERRQLWREEAGMESNIRNAELEHQQAYKTMLSTIDKMTGDGLKSCDRLAKSLGLAGYYGPLSDLFTVDDKYRTCVEVTAGNSLFHVVVDTEETAVKLIEAMNREKSGRVTFMPLNRLHPSIPHYPDADDALPLISKIRFETHLTPAIQQVFGKTVVCPDVETAARYAQQNQVNGITLQGDRADRKGVISGGYYDTRKSRLRAIHNERKWRNVLEKDTSRAEVLRKRLSELGQQITETLGQVQLAEARRKAINDSFMPIMHELSERVKDDANLKEHLSRQKAMLENVESDMLGHKQQLEAAEAELRSPFKRNISSEDESKLDMLSRLLDDAKREYSRTELAWTEVDGQKTLLQSALSENLYILRDSLSAQIHDAQTLSGESVNQRGTNMLEKTVSNIENLGARLESLEKSLEGLTTQITSIEEEVDALRKRQIALSASIDREQNMVESNVSKRAMITQQREQTSRSIRDLGVLPQDAFEKYQKTSSETILKRLHKVRETLKRLGHVNKQAFEQYSGFKKQQEQLSERRSELDTSHESIKELIQVLDQRKDEALQRTFKQVSRNFARVFENLVPAGAGCLIMQRHQDTESSEDNADQSHDADDGDDDDNGHAQGDVQESPAIVESYVGVAISVSFNSKEDEQQRIQQLSGGQKALCALALIFAIQQCDPAPFYLFDEIDANLDARYRESLARMLAQMSEHGQFICTTFRPEQIQFAASKFYGVLFNHRVSTLEAITKDEALKFVENNAH